MSFFSKIWKDIRDPVEAAASVAGNYLLPGSSLLTDHLVSKGAQSELSSPLGEIAQIGSGLAGGGVGESITGIPAASEIGAGWTNAANGLGGLFNDATLGTDAANGFSNALSGLGLGGSASTVGQQVPVDSNAGASAFSLGGAGAPVSGGVTGPSDALTGAWDQNGFGGLDSAGNALPPAGASGVNAATGLPGEVAGAGGAGAAAAPAAASGAGGSGFSGVLSKLGISPMQALAGAGVGLNALKGDKKTGAEKNEAQLASQQSATGNNLVNLGMSGQLTPGQQATMQQQMNDAITTIKSNYAQQGMSGSSAEANAIGQAQQQYAAQITQAAQGEISAGMSALGMGSQANQAIAQQQVQQDQSLYNSIIALAGSSAGGAQKNKEAA